jgi:putative tryptophan/tyrosine transport system substrate-binding protein
MNRRELMLLLGGAMTAASALRAQQKAMPVIGYLNGTSPVPGETSLAAFRQGLGETGYVEGQNLAIEYRWAMGRYDRLPALAAELVGRKVDVMAATGGSARRQKTQARRSRSSSPEAATRSQTAWSPVSRGRAVTSRA